MHMHMRGLSVDPCDYAALVAAPMVGGVASHCHCHASPPAPPPSVLASATCAPHLQLAPRQPMAPTCAHSRCRAARRATHVPDLGPALVQPLFRGRYPAARLGGVVLCVAQEHEQVGVIVPAKGESAGRWGGQLRVPTTRRFSAAVMLRAGCLHQDGRIVETGWRPLRAACRTA